MPSAIKAHIVFEFRSSPWGGGNQFLWRLREYLRACGAYAEAIADADIVLFNSHHSFDDVFQARRSFPDKIFVHRVDGPISFHRGARSYLVDRYLSDFNRRVANATIFQSQYSLRENSEKGVELVEPWVIIPNGIAEVQTPERRYSPNNVARIIISTWSDNPNKGFEIYKYLDSHLPEGKHSCSIVGNCRYQFSRIKSLGVLDQPALAEQLRNHDILLSAGLFDVCPNSVLEAKAQGLRLVLRDSGGHPEILHEGDLLFQGRADLLETLDRAAVELPQRKGLRLSKQFTIESVGTRYLEFFRSLRDGGNYRRIHRSPSTFGYQARRLAYKVRVHLESGRRLINYDRRVLVAGDVSAETLRLSAALQRAGIDADLLTFSRTFSIGGWRYFDNRFRLEGFGMRHEKTRNELLDILKRGKYESVVPSSEYYLIALRRFEADISQFSALAKESPVPVLSLIEGVRRGPVSALDLGVRAIAQDFRRLSRQLSLFRLRPDRGSALDSYLRSTNVLFLGNTDLALAPFAHALSTLQNSPGGRFSSAALNEHGDDQAPYLFAACANSFGVDLSTHRNTTLDAGRLDSQTFAVTFDSRTQAEAVYRFPQLAGHCAPIGLLTGSYHEFDEELDACAAQILDTLGPLAADIRQLVELR